LGFFSKAVEEAIPDRCDAHENEKMQIPPLDPKKAATFAKLALRCLKITG